jgi:hypothetical protein
MQSVSLHAANVKMEVGSQAVQHSNQTLNLRPTILAVPDALSTDALCDAHATGATLEA